MLNIWGVLHRSYSPVQQKHRQTWYTLWTVVCLSMLSGCTDDLPERVPVSGTVFIDGKPLTRGSIMVIPAGERPAGGSIGADGRFTLTSRKPNDGVTLGTHPVTIQSTEHLSERETLWLVPKKYGNASRSGLSVTIDGPIDDLKIELTWEGKKPYVQRM